MPPLRRPYAPTLLLSAVLSASLHIAAIAAIPARRSPTAAAPAFDPASQTLAGETLDVEPAAEEPGTEASEAPDLAAAAPLPPGATSARSPSPSRRMARPADAPAARGASGARPALFGAVDIRYATDLATTFARAFPQAASADPSWATAPFGSAGMADVTLRLDDAGRLEASTTTGSPSGALRRGVERTLALLGSRAFTARGATTKLRVVARVGKDEVHDGLHGDVFALSGGSFSGDVGVAFFALPSSNGPGRRIDVELRLLP